MIEIFYYRIALFMYHHTFNYIFINKIWVESLQSHYKALADEHLFFLLTLIFFAVYGHFWANLTFLNFTLVKKVLFGFLPIKLFSFDPMWIYKYFASDTKNLLWNNHIIFIYLFVSLKSKNYLFCCIFGQFK